MANLLQKLFSGLTQSGITLPNGQFENERQAQDTVPELPDFIKEAGGMNAGAQPSSVQTPSFLQAMKSGPGGTPNAMSPALSTKGKILTTLLSGAFGALAGAGQRTVGGGFQAGAQLPWEQAQFRQNAQRGQLENEKTQQDMQFAPLLRQLGIQKTQADISKSQADAKCAAFQTTKNGVYNTDTQQFAPGSQPPEKTDNIDQMISSRLQDIQRAGGDPRADQQLQQMIQTKQSVVAKPDKPGSPEQQYIDEFRSINTGATVAQALKAYKRDTEAPQKDPQQLAVGPDGTVLALRPGMKVPLGTKPASQYGKPTADEQRRADLAGNLNENLDQLEEIVNRRPELFGPLAGRWTDLKGKFGSNDPDIAGLQVIEHQVGMAQISAHGMRSAHGIGDAANSIFNGLHSGPQALKSAISKVRTSVKTFQDDVAKAKGEMPSAPAGGMPQRNASKANDPLGIR